ncbi:MAG TPA: HlyD family efflux transporter periplasmic adaptor subunit [Bacteroidia bacterium]|nr:HlyD family efflux transporter periplasmic adaptor subunit [Bacteroidia bacterium]
MSTKKEDINIRSEEVVDIMSKVPHAFVRYGLLAMFLLTFIGIGLMWSIKYPDINLGKIKISTTNAPVKLISQTNGILTKIFIKEGAYVKAGTLIASIENPLTPETAIYLQKYAKDLEASLKFNESRLPLPKQNILTTDELQVTINQLTESVKEFNLNRHYQIDEKELNSILEKINNRKKLIEISERMVEIANRDLIMTKQKFLSEEKLFHDSVITKIDFIQLESSYRKKQLETEKINESLLQQKDELNELEIQAEQIKFNKFQKYNNTIETVEGHLKTIKSYVIGWKQKFNLVATKSGQLTFIQRIQVGDFIEVGSELFVITPDNASYIGIAEFTGNGIGKIKINQTAQIHLKNYPFYEFGTVNGKVKHISNFPQNNLYRVEILLIDGLKTNQNLKLNYYPEMEGEVEVITADKRLLERLLESIKKALKRKK